MNDLPQLAGTVLVTFAGYDLDGPEEGALLRAAGLQLKWYPRFGERTPEEIAAAAAGATAAVVDVDPFDQTVFERVPDLRLVARTGVGFDSIDLEAATRFGVAVTTTPGTNHEAVADHTISMILACLRRTVANDAQVRAGGWERIGVHAGWQLHGETVGLIGCGRIGLATLRRLLSFGVRALVHDPALRELDGCELVSLEQLLRESDVVSLHTPLNDETEHIINAETLSMMKPTSILVNTSRGGLVDEPALLDALEDGRLRGAGLDVFEVEPPELSRLRAMETVVLSPHIAGMTAQTIAMMSRAATRDVLDVLSGTDFSSVLNPAALELGKVTKR